MSARLLTCLVGLTALASGCTEAGSPMPSTSTTAPATTREYGAPGVHEPIAPGRFRKDPCAVLTPEQSGGLGWEPEGTAHKLESNDPYCDWDNEKTLETFVFGWLASNSGGLDDTYRVFKNDTGYFEPVVIEGYPGVFHFSEDLRPRGHCNLVVGIRDELTFHVDGDGDGPEVCDTVREMAVLAITTMKAG
ncbi:DUF3558 domain-containing protein [Actinokineospora cianjurensis]|uniref:Uncharacterized protein DUF3558 n=1 Tax=Actinokineospora cianjurensis TaxID=585224 RepID=A0A421B620_9PSEU|nr:DUF3558 domain-containing protein [Actinokineospora cianjurensis]RLK59789.1 uncharacterized protein DUF3558 [Actinokineospora cianjurensis]